MIYKLILIVLLTTDTHETRDMGSFDDIMSCFDARENLLVETESWEGYFPRGMQAVCISFDLEK